MAFVFALPCLLEGEHMVRRDNKFVPLHGMEQCHCLPGEPGSWSLCLGNRGGTPDLLHCLQQQILGEKNERKKAHSGEKAEVPLCPHSLLDTWDCLN